MIRRQIADDAHTTAENCLHAQQLEVAQLDGHIHLFLFIAHTTCSQSGIADIAGCQRLCLCGFSISSSSEVIVVLPLVPVHRAVTEMSARSGKPISTSV